MKKKFLPKILFFEKNNLPKKLQQKICGQNFSWTNKFFPKMIFGKKKFTENIFTKHFFCAIFFSKNILKKIFWKKISDKKNWPKKVLQKKICRKKVRPKLFLLRNSYLRSKYSLHITLEAKIWHLESTCKISINYANFWMVLFFLVWFWWFGFPHP